jgi:prolycopene isomerase
MEDSYDVIVVGAGVGGLTVASLAAKEGLRTLLVEQCDRVGGRALTIRGEEILWHGASWYKTLLAKQYTWIPYAEPSLEDIISRQKLSGYTLDVGYHGVALNGDGYFLDLDERIGTGVPMVGNLNSTYVGDEWYLDFDAGKMDERLKKIAEENRIPFVKFYLAAARLKDGDFDRLESVSVTQWCKDNGLYENKTIFGMIHAVSTLITTINDPDDISIGDIFRYMGTVINPRFKAGRAKWPSGFTTGGIMRWSQAVANRFVEMGGTLELGARVREILIENGRAVGVMVEDRTGAARKIKASRVVSNIPIQDTFKVADKGAFPAEWADRMEGLYGYGSIAPYFGLNGWCCRSGSGRSG